MGFKNEVRIFMRSERNRHKKGDATVKAYKKLVDKLMKQNGELFDRLAARSYPELKTFTLPDGEMREEVYDATSDEGLAGEVTFIDKLQKRND